MGNREAKPRLCWKEPRAPRVPHGAGWAVAGSTLPRLSPPHLARTWPAPGPVLFSVLLPHVGQAQNDFLVSRFQTRREGTWRWGGAARSSQ